MDSVIRTASVYEGNSEYTFPYDFGANCSSTIRQRIKILQPDLVILVTDRQVWKLHSEALDGVWSPIETFVIKVPQGEKAKCVSTLSDVLSQAIEAGATRQSIVVTFGGGATGNLGGLVAALLFRGVRLVHLPTTTIGAFDSVISMKQAVNSESGKNQIGAYLRPSAVIVDTCWFDTLLPEFSRGGWCEAAKNALAINPTQISALKKMATEPDTNKRWVKLFDMSLAAKMTVMTNDPFERREGVTLEYGHTIGHAIEYAAAEANLVIPHGDAICLGLIAAARISGTLGHLDANSIQVHEALVASLGAPTRLPRNLELERVLNLVRRDNKRGLIPCSDGEIAMVILEDLGKPIKWSGGELPLTQVPIKLIRSALYELSQ